MLNTSHHHQNHTYVLLPLTNDTKHVVPPLASNNANTSNCPPPTITCKRHLTHATAQTMHPASHHHHQMTLNASHDRSFLFFSFRHYMSPPPCDYAHHVN